MARERRLTLTMEGGTDEDFEELYGEVWALVKDRWYDVVLTRADGSGE